MTSIALIAGILGGGLLTAGGSIGGAAIASKGGGVTQKALKDAPAAGFNTETDPVANALRASLLQSLGLPTGSLMSRASPISNLQNVASSGTMGLVNQNNMAQLNTGLQIVQGILGGVLPTPQKSGGRAPGELPEGFNPATASDDEILAVINQFMPRESRLMLEGAATAAGIQGGIRGLIAQERQFIREQEEVRPMLERIERNQLQARGTASDQMLQLLQDFPRGTQDDINRVSEVERGRMRDALLQQANVAGVNPAAGLSELERDVNPIARAVALLGGGQQLALNQLGAANQALFGPVELAISGSSPLLAAAQGQASIAAQQAATISGLPQNENHLGTGVAAGLGGLGNSISTLALMGMLNQSTASPGASGVGVQGGNKPLG